MKVFIGVDPHKLSVTIEVVDEPARRGCGNGTFLMASIENSARAAGTTRLALDVAAKNRDARRLYERLGMTVLAESARWFRLPDTNVIRMTKPLLTA